MKPAPEKIRLTAKWIEYADEDLARARNTLRMRSRMPARLVAYHAQQCAEKCLKAWLVWRDVDFPHTHNIARLLELVAEQKAGWVTELATAAALSPYAITARYPGEDEPVTRAEAAAAVGVAATVRKVLRSALHTEGILLPRDR